jgi:hypothetical protein
MDPKLADESVAEKFTRVMNATPSAIGLWSDVAAASALSALIIVVGFFAIRRSTEPVWLYAVLALAAAPLVASLLVATLLVGSRAKVVAWLGSLPFAIDNLNALLAGLGDTIEVEFEEGSALPTRPMLQPKLDEVSDDVLLVRERPELRCVEIRLGVIDSKRTPLRTNHLRWIRFVAVVERTLVPLAKTAPIRRVLVV